MKSARMAAIVSVVAIAVGANNDGRREMLGSRPRVAEPELPRCMLPLMVEAFHERPRGGDTPLGFFRGCSVIRVRLRSLLIWRPAISAMRLYCEGLATYRMI